MKLSEDTWTTVGQAIPWLLHHYGGRRQSSSAGEIHVQLRDTETQYRIEFVIGQGGLAVIVDVSDRIAQLRPLYAVLDQQSADLWRVAPLDSAAPLTASSEWQHSDPPARYKALCDSIVPVMRDGLAMNIGRLRSSIWTRTGPSHEPSWGLFALVGSDRPTARGADVRCCGWDDFTERLQWVLTTLPVGGGLVLEAPSHTTTPHLIQFKRGHNVHGLAVLQCRHNDTRNHRSMMRDLGWHHEPDLILSNTAQTWTHSGSRGRSSSSHELADRTALTLQTLFQVDHPGQLSCRTKSRSGSHTGYIAMELGLCTPPMSAPAPQRVL